MQNNIPKVQLYSDWWAVPNPWRWWYWIILSFKWVKKEFFQGFKNTTNNRMELLWIISWLEKLKNESEVEVFTDSQYSINWIEKWWAEKWEKNGWKRAKNQKVINPDLWKKLLILTKKHKVKFFWVKGHNGHKENERCDELATLALNWKNLIEDIWFEEKNLENISQNISLFEEKVLEKKEAKSPILNKKNTNKIENNWDICGKCNTAVIQKTPKNTKWREKKQFYYEYFFQCPNCKTNYMPDKWKRYN